MSNASTPPTRDLPAEIEAAINNLCWFAVPYRADEHPNYNDAAKNLRQSIRVALNDQDAALRERCERLRQQLVSEGWRPFPGESTDTRGTKYLQPGDLADDLIPRGGDE